jgi:hypothetical protein
MNTWRELYAERSGSTSRPVQYLVSERGMGTTFFTMQSVLAMFLAKIEPANILPGL